MTPDPEKKYIAWCGAETDLIFNKGIDLPGFASFPLLEKPETRALLQDYAHAQIELASSAGFGTILETATWIANADRAAPLGYDAPQLATANRDAVQMLAEVRSEAAAPDVLISANVGPRGDGYAPDSYMSAEDAQSYHATQINTLSETACDMISGYTLCYPEEAIGIVRAAQAAGKPVVIAFTVETDGMLPNGQALDTAIDQVDAATAGGAAYFMVNCAHPTHFLEVLTSHPRLRGVVVNASTCSHAELDVAEELDDGDPERLGQEVAALIAHHPALQVFGGCCGTDMRHLSRMAQEVKAL